MLTSTMTRFSIADGGEAEAALASNLPKLIKQRTHVPRYTAPHPSAQFPPDLRQTLITFGIIALAVYVLSLPVALRSVHRFNRNVYLLAMQRWEASFMCQSCGLIVEMSSQELPAKTG